MSRGLAHRLRAAALKRSRADLPPSSEWEVEQAVRDRLYGERPKLITVTPIVAESRHAPAPAVDRLPV
jgi:hypothetical protein